VRIKSVVVCVELRGHLVSHAIPLSNGSKKRAELPHLSETLVKPDANDPEATTLELDELWSFVLKKANKVWIWIALCRKTRQVVAYAVGDRSKNTCQKLWDAIPEE
jgi:insertion element IS1 protein InsB